MKIKLLLLYLANTILVALCSYKDEAIVKWPFCEFKEGTFEEIYKKLGLRALPESPLYCHLPYYEWETDGPPDFEKVTSEIAYLMDIIGEHFSVLATFWTNGRLTPHGGGFQVILNAVREIDISKYSVISFYNKRTRMSGLFFRAKDAKGENLIYVSVCENSWKFEEQAFITEKKFLVAWNEHIKGQALENTCLDL